MIEFVWIDGTAVRVSSCVRRGRGGEREVELVVIARGEGAHQEMVGLLEAGWVTVGIPEGDGVERFGAEVVAARHDVIGRGEARAYRHAVTLRERALDAREVEVGELPVAVRLAALIEALDRAGLVKRDEVEAIARRMVNDDGTASPGDASPAGSA